MIRSLLIALTLLSFSAKAQLNQDESYQFFMNLRDVQDDQFSIELITPYIMQDEIIYQMPKMVPGTYSIYDFGRFVTDFRAFDKNNNELTVTKPNVNQFKIKDAKKLFKIRYKVNDTWDADTSNFIFEPAGSSIEKDTAYMINTHCVFGYFHGMTRSRYHIFVNTPEKMFGSTSLKNLGGGQLDHFVAENYMELADAPMMYARPDTSILNIGGANILISIYDENKYVNSDFIATNIKDIMEAANRYLGGKLPVEKYAFLIYLFEPEADQVRAGALEHSYSSVYYMPSQKDSASVSNFIRNVAAHEFFHIITPLNLHSEEIGDFNYENPEMSSHLWLYEGVTEFTAHYVQFRENLISLDEYLHVLEEKIQNSQQFYNDTLAFTALSEGALDIYEDQYTNVYEKGAMIGFCLDVLIRYHSEGKKGLKDIIAELSKLYGKDRSFKDEELFTVIEKLSYPEVGTFLRRYVGGSERLPYREIFSHIGMDYFDTLVNVKYTLGNVAIGYDPNSPYPFHVVNDANADAFGKKFGWKKGDRLIEMNGEALTIQNAQELIGKYYADVNDKYTLKAKVLRKNKKGKDKTVKLKAKAFKVNVVETGRIIVSRKLNERQQHTRTSWRGKSEN